MQYFKSKSISKRTGKMSKVSKVILAGLMVTALAGCKTRQEQLVGHQLSHPSQRHPIMVSKKPIYLDIDVPRGSAGLTSAQADNVRAFLNEYRRQGSGKLIISAPSGSPNEVAAFKALKRVRGLIKDDGIAYNSVEMTPYYQEGDPQPPLKISYVRYVAEGPSCGQWHDDLANDDRNTNYANFGCASQQNIAAMVDNPRDLIEPRGMGPRSSERRDSAWKKYVSGQTTITKRDAKEESGKVADAQGGGES